jgi:hypothetical protein
VNVCWQLFPKSARPVPEVEAVCQVFSKYHGQFSSDSHDFDSNSVLKIVARELIQCGFAIEEGKSAAQKIHVPVLFGENGAVLKSFYADGFHPGAGVVVEVEAGRAVDNNQWMKDLFQACMMQDALHLVIAVRQNYRGANDYEKVKVLVDTLYSSQRLILPLKSVTILGY